MNKYLPILIGILFFSKNIIAQTNPAAQVLPYSFTAITGALPNGMATHRFGTSAGSIPTSRILTPGNGDLPNVSGNSGGWHNQGVDGVGLLASGSQAAGAVVVAINTIGKSNIRVSWVCKTILQQVSRDNSIALQYRVGITGNFINVGTTTTYSSAGQSEGHTSQLFQEILPAAAENQAVVQVRWVYWESVSTGGSRDKISVDEINIAEVVPMPVNWLGVSASKTNELINVKWSTAEEINNKSFEVERSNDGRNFKFIGQKLPIQNLSSVNEYNFIDQNPVKGINYYRIKQIDINGTYSYSQIVSLMNNTNKAIIYYDQNFNQLILQEIAAEANCFIYDLSGSLIFQRKSVSGKIDLSSLEIGTYIALIKAGEESLIQKFIKF